MSLKLIKSTAVTGGMTLLSRVSGLIRDIVFANIMGSGLVADAFFVAFRIPNFFRRIFGEGALSQAFVPVYSEYRERQTSAETQSFLNHMVGRLGLILISITVVGVLSAPGIVTVIAPGFIGDNAKFALTVDALRICFPYLFFISLVAVSAGILNTSGRFAVPAATPIFLNLALISAAVWLVPAINNAALALSIGVLVAGIVQLLFQFPFLKREKALPRPQVRNKNPGVSKVFKLMLPAIFGVSVAQINVLVNTLLASFLITGSVSWLYYSDRVMEFPLGVFGIALATVILPSLSKMNARAEHESFSNLIDWSMRWGFLISVPAAVGLIVLAAPLIATMFFHGATTADDVRMMANALVAYSVGLVALVLVKILAPGFFARQDTKTPVRVGVIAMLVNIVMCVILVGPLKHVGLALATSIAAWVNAGFLYKLLRDGNVYNPKKGWSVYLAKVFVAGAVMAGVVMWGAGDFADWIGISIVDRVLKLSMWVGLGMVAYFLVILALGIRPRQLLLKSKDL